MVEVSRMCPCWICARGTYRVKPISVHLRGVNGEVAQRQIRVCTRCYVDVSAWVREHPEQEYAVTAAVSERLEKLMNPLRLKDGQEGQIDEQL